MKSSEICLMSPAGERVAKRSGQMVPWNQTFNGSEITSCQLDGDPWKTRWSAMKVGDRPRLSDWATDLPAGFDYDAEPDDPGTQSEQELAHQGDDDEEEEESNESHRHEDLRRAPLSRSEKSEGLQLDRRKRLRTAGKDADVRVLSKLLSGYFDRRSSKAMDAAPTPAYYDPHMTVGQALSQIKSQLVDSRKDPAKSIHWVALREFLTHFDSNTRMRHVNKATVDAQLRALKAKLN